MIKYKLSTYKLVVHGEYETDDFKFKKCKFKYEVKEGD